MMLSRTALRLAVVEVLSPYAENASGATAWPTFAGPAVFDTQISPTALADVDKPGPLIVVYTDETSLKADGTDVTLASSSTKQRVTLAFEIQVPVSVPTDAGGAVLTVGPTDAGAEALLDLLEEQILQRIADGRMNGPLVDILAEIVEVDSQPYRDPDTETRLSARRLELICSVKRGERWPSGVAVDADPLAWLPAPFSKVAALLPLGSYGRKVATMLGGLIGQPALFPALDELRLAANLTRSAGDALPPATDAAATPPVGDIGGQILP